MKSWSPLVWCEKEYTRARSWLARRSKRSSEISEINATIYVRLESFTRDEMIFRVGWWMKDTDDYYTLRQLVNRAIVKTLKEAGMVFPYLKEQVGLEPNSYKSEIPGKSNQA